MTETVVARVRKKVIRAQRNKQGTRFTPEEMDLLLEIGQYELLAAQEAKELKELARQRPEAREAREASVPARERADRAMVGPAPSTPEEALERARRLIASGKKPAKRKS
ncbi:hypothetical protein [Allosphingosinicella deserti]|uniref:Uncharacterized protein n=1 Tax=Allosphingosinicella deserti TaxID=2116704 RepID=A0A2P7QW10_9SPHN|nr:hypothetical protein [Sphingomonas deserti]PSJ42143.1 hypothetical protein C7I55_07875 [Sphingomonas deserti]